MNETWDQIILETSAPPISPHLEALAVEDLRKARCFLERAAADPELSRAKDTIAHRLRSEEPSAGQRLRPS